MFKIIFFKYFNLGSLPLIESIQGKTELNWDFGQIMYIFDLKVQLRKIQ